jgi:hypothetical protein
MMAKINLEVERRVQEEVKKRLATQSESLVTRLFPEEVPEEADDAAKEYEKRMERAMNQDQKWNEVQSRQNKRANSKDLLEEEQQRQKKEWFDEQQKIKDLQRQLQEEKKKNEEFQKQWTESPWQDYEEEDDLQKWYSAEDQQKGRSSKEEENLQSPKTKKTTITEDPKEEEKELSTREMLKIMMNQHEKTLETVLKAKTPESKRTDEVQRDWLEEVKIRPVNLEELEELEDVTEGNSSIKCGDWLYRITPSITNLSKKTNEFWTKGKEVVQKRYEDHLKATPIERLSMEFPLEDIEVNPVYEKSRSTITEMLLKAIPKDLAAEAITKRLDNPLKILLLIMVKYQPGGRKEREAILNQITNPEVCWYEDKGLEAIRTWK